MLLYATRGVMRQLQNLRDGRKPAYGAGDEMDWQIHIEGSLGEGALAKYHGVYHGGIGKLRAPDVGVVDVRTAAKHSHRLMIHPPDPDDRVFWFVTGTNGKYQIRGWLLAKDGKRKEWWQDPKKKDRWAFFVPTSELHAP
jgi:hypothetical protein